MTDRPQTPDEIRVALLDLFHVTLTQDRFDEGLARLGTRGLTLQLPNGAIRLTSREREALGAEIAAAEDAEERARAGLRTLAALHCPDLDPDVIWVRLHSEYLGPLIHEVDGDAHRLVVGDTVTPNVRLVERFLAHFQPAVHPGLRDLATAFLDQANQSARAYVIRSLHARLCVEASGLPEKTIASLKAQVGVQTRFRVFIDTNVLFPLLGLDESAANVSARELLDVIASLKQNPAVDLYMFIPTVTETTRVLAAARRALSPVPNGLNYSRAAMEVNSSGLTSRFFAERVARSGNLTAEAWFRPYEESPARMASAKGVRLFNQSAESLLSDSHVLEDVAHVERWESHRDAGRGKRREAILHDVVLWHFVNHLRGAYVESPAEARDWILTFDHRFVGFDHHKQKHLKSSVPLCLHPTSFIQLLQFWVPRTAEFEDAVLAGFRLPFLHQEFDPEAEKTSLRILGELARFDGGDEIPAETIVKVLFNEGLRARLRQAVTQDIAKEIAWIGEALLEETRGRAESAAAKAQAAEEHLQEREIENAFLKVELEEKQLEVRDLQARIEGAEARLFIADEITRDQGIAVRQLTERVDAERSERRRRRRCGFYYKSLAALCLGAGLSAAGLAYSFPTGKYPFTRVAGAVSAFTCVFLVGHLLVDRWASRRTEVTETALYRRVTATRAFLWTVVVLGLVIQVVGGLYANKVQNELDRMKTSAAGAPAKTDGGGRR